MKNIILVASFFLFLSSYAKPSVAQESARCDDIPSFRLGDRFSIRSLDSNPLKKYLASTLGESIYSYTHWYIDIEAKDSSQNPCVFTVGLKMSKENKSGLLKYKGTELQSPDFSDSVCNSKASDCKKDTKCATDVENIRKICVGAAASEGTGVIRGKIMADPNPLVGTLNVHQINILNWFKIHAKVHEISAKKVRYWNALLPFTFSWTPDHCSVKDWGSEEYFNCQKFSQVFLLNPESIAKHLSPELYATTQQFQFEVWYKGFRAEKSAQRLPPLYFSLIRGAELDKKTLTPTKFKMLRPGERSDDVLKDGWDKNTLMIVSEKAQPQDTDLVYVFDLSASKSLLLRIRVADPGEKSKHRFGPIDIGTPPDVEPKWFIFGPQSGPSGVFKAGKTESGKSLKDNITDSGIVSKKIAWEALLRMNFTTLSEYLKQN